MLWRPPRRSLMTYSPVPPRSGWEIAELFGCAESLKETGNQGRTIEVYKTWIAFNADHPLLHAPHFNYAVILSEHHDFTGCEKRFD
jgi:hypothetical protein